MKSAYFDHAACTPIDSRVLEAMLPYFKEVFGNPSSLYDLGRAAKGAIEEARAKASDLIGAKSDEIIFTGSGTEANNFAVKGIAEAYQKKGNHIIVSAIEHFSVLHPAKSLEKKGFEVSTLPVDKHGLVDPQNLADAITPKTILVSIMQANNEIGTVQPIKDLAKIAKEKGAVFHTDAIASAGVIPVNVNELGVDALSFTCNQFYGPKGAGALYLRKGIRIMPLIEGGIQEDGKRAGTEAAPEIVGFGAAAELAKKEMTERIKKLTPLRDKLMKGLQEKIENFYLTGHPEKRLPNHVSGCVEFIEGESMTLFLNMEGIYAATGSACVSRALKASHVILSIGIDPALAHGSLVFTMGKDNTEEDVDYLLEKLPPIVQRLREMSPLYKKGREK